MNTCDTWQELYENTCDTWQELFEAAVLETKIQKMQPRVLAAKAAIDARLHELTMEHGSTSEERLAISDALTCLNLLRREVETRSHDTGSSNGGEAAR